MRVTKQSQLLEALRSGEQLTATEISQRFGIKNPTATVSDLRFNGFAVYANQRKNQPTTYRLGTPSRKVVAAGYRALSLGLDA